MEKVTTVSKADLASAPATEAQQALINDRVAKGEPPFEEDREDFVPEKTAEEKEAEAAAEADTRKNKLEELGLSDDATDDDITAAEEKKKAESEEGKSPEEIEADKEAARKKKEEEESGDDDEQKAFEKADETGKADLITEKELELEEEEDEDKKKEMQDTIDSWKEFKPETKELDDEDTEKEITEYAKEKEISTEDAREMIEGRDKLRKKHGDNPKELAHALRMQQIEYTKEKVGHDNTVKALEEARLNVLMSSDIKPETLFKNKDGSAWTKDQVIEAYREKYPGQTDGKEDDEVYDLSRQATLRVLQSNRKIEAGKIETEAKSKRIELMTNLPKEAEPYRDQIKKDLDEAPDSMVSDKSFNIQDLIYFNVGKDSKKREQEAEQRGYKRGLEKRRIVGNQQPPKGSTRTKKDVSSKESFGLSDVDKKKALEVFGSNDVPEKRKFELYAGILAKEKTAKAEKDKKDKK